MCVNDRGLLFSVLLLGDIRIVELGQVNSSAINDFFSKIQRSNVSCASTIGPYISFYARTSFESEEPFMGHPLLDLTNKTAVVIGGTSGIGLTLARGLAEAGANVVPTGRREEHVRAAAAEIVSLGRRSLAQTCDVTDNASL